LPLADSIDQILVRGLPSTSPVRWPDDRRRVDGRLLSDHAPVELTVG
jgi:endonuclease/exonuclease/phosphatase family metal-dependent hydrolase